MMISTRGRYALRVMINLAEKQTKEFTPLKEIAEAQQLSEKYLESIVKALVQNGLLEGVRGKGGGYRLKRAPENCTVGSILRMTEVGLAPVACLENDPVTCPRAGVCRTLPMWQKLQRMLNEFFEGITVADLMDLPDKPAKVFIDDFAEEPSENA